jgi:hypothetical protein
MWLRHDARLQRPILFLRETANRTITVNQVPIRLSGRVGSLGVSRSELAEPISTNETCILTKRAPG